MKLAAPAIADGAAIPRQFTCDGGGRSPALTWSGHPAGTKSFALVLDDPDAPGGTFAHWAVFDIGPNVHALGEGAGSANNSALHQAVNDFGTPGYGAPCPPPGRGPHHYHFQLFALDVPSLGLSPSPKVFEVRQAVEDHVLDTAELTATYGRQGP
jgi:Raf kinase inhibitor-like YbhB/YbcL family protein